ncbi:MAG TPA: phage tail protein [Thermoanaerobaculia bacterium]
MPELGLNAAVSLTANLLGIRNDPYTAFNFFVEIESLVVGGFSEVSGLQVETAVEEYQEGGENGFVHKLAGPTRYPNLVLKRGLTFIDTLWIWHQEVTSGKVQRRNGTLYLLDNRRLPAMWWDFKGAYPVKWIGPDLRADSNTIAVETVELVHQGLSRPSSGRVLSGAQGALSLSGSFGL